MNQTASKFLIATAVLMAPAAGTAANVSAHSAAVASQPPVSAESASMPAAASPQFESAAADTAARIQPPASTGLEEFAGAQPSFVFNLAIKK